MVIYGVGGEEQSWADSSVEIPLAAGTETARCKSEEEPVNAAA
jgi:hypothetical protein